MPQSPDDSRDRTYERLLEEQERAIREEAQRRYQSLLDSTILAGALGQQTNQYLQNHPLHAASITGLEPPLTHEQLRNDMARINTKTPIFPTFTPTPLDPNRFVGRSIILKALRGLPKTKGIEVISDTNEKWVKLERTFRNWCQNPTQNYNYRKSISTRRRQWMKILQKWFKTTDLVWTHYVHSMGDLTYMVSLKKNCEEVWSNSIHNNPIWVTKKEISENKDYILWDEHQKLYYYHTSASNYITYKSGRKATVRFAAVKNWTTTICNCSDCKNYVLKAETKECPITDNFRCEKCSQLALVPNVNDLHSSNETNIIKSYHEHGPTWKIHIARVDEKDRDIPFGIELEIHSKLGNNIEKANESAWHIAKAQQDHNEDWNYFYFEKDGSLMEGGFEMVTQPMTLGFHKQFWPVMLPKIREVAVGWNTYQLAKEWGLYGIHITFSRKYWSDWDLARLVKFLDNPDNAWFVRGIAQRDRQYKTEDASLLAQKKRSIAERITLRDKKISGGKYRNQPVNIKPVIGQSYGLCEVRIFRSTLNTESFFKNIEFLHAFRAWCKESPFRVGAMDFITWLSKSQFAQVTYPNLIGYLSRPKFPCRGTKGIKNPIATHFKHVKGIAVPIDVSKATVEDRLKDDLESCASS